MPKGRRSEDGKVPYIYEMIEHPSPNYPPRTRANVHYSDATLLFIWEEYIPRSRGTALTAEICESKGKPLLAIDPRSEDHSEVREWLEEHEVQTLNIAGPRESICSGIHDQVVDFLAKALG